MSVPVYERLRRMEHYRWVAERLIAGWKYAPERNDTKKTRWQITPWDNLDSPPQAIKDKAAAAGKQLNEKLKDERIVKLILGLMRSGRLKVVNIDAAQDLDIIDLRNVP